MPNPTPASVHVDGYLTSFSHAFAQEQTRFVADRVFPNIPVQKATDLYLKFDDEWFRRDEFEERPLGGRSKRIGYKTSSGTYRCIEESLAHAIDDRVRANADEPLNPDRAATRLLTEQALIHRERDWVANFFGQSIWDNDAEGVAAGPTGDQFLQWDQSASNPIADIDLWKDTVDGATARMPNKLILGVDTYRLLKQNQEILDRIKYTQRGVITLELLASMFEVDEIAVARGIWNTAAEGIAESTAYIANTKSALLVYAAPAPAIETPSGGYTFSWTNLIPGAGNAMGGVIERRRDDDAHSDIIEMRMAFDQRIAAPSLGVFFRTVVA